MTMPSGPCPPTGSFAVFWSSAKQCLPWHVTCTGSGLLKKNSQSVTGSVNFFNGRAKPVSCLRERLPRTDDLQGSIHGAGRHGYRKRTHVRAACGDTRRPAGEGNNSTHGHFGRFVVGRFVSHGIPTPTVVLQPVCEAVLRQRHLSRGPGLPAALTALVVSSVRTPAHTNRAFRATRPLSPAMRRAASFPPTPAGMSCGRERRTQPQPTHASAFG